MGINQANIFIELEQAFKNHDKTQEELTRYFPVALIACVESYFRMAIKDLIDAGKPRKIARVYQFLRWCTSSRTSLRDMVHFCTEINNLIC